MKTITTHHQAKIADHRMTAEEIKSYANENNYDLVGFSYLTKNDDGTFEEEALSSKLKVFHFSSALFNWQENLFNILT